MFLKPPTPNSPTPTPLHCFVVGRFNYLTTASSLCQRRLISSVLSTFHFTPPPQTNPFPQSKTSLYCFNFLYNLKLFRTLGLMYVNKTEYRKGNPKMGPLNQAPTGFIRKLIGWLSALCLWQKCIWFEKYFPECPSTFNMI